MKLRDGEQEIQSLFFRPRRATAKFCLNRQKFALIGIPFAEIGKQDAETGN